MSSISVEFNEASSTLPRHPALNSHLKTMLVRDMKRAALIIGPLFGLLLISLTLWATPAYSAFRSRVGPFVWKPPSAAGHSVEHSHQEIFSLSTPDTRYFPIEFGNLTAFNPNIIPHPTRNLTWIIVSQKRRVNPDGSDPSDSSAFHVELGCNAQFTDGALKCTEWPDVLPIAATAGNKCTGDLMFMGWNIGPHDARVFYGPKKPFIMFGSNSRYACFGMFLQDFRVLVDWKPVTFGQESHRMATELQRPPPYGIVEKNWFIWWDKDDKMYAHYDFVPRRVFAKLDHNGSAGKDLAPPAAEHDRKCVDRYLPKIPKELEDIHQATNSLKITMCRRSDGSCVPNNTNTLIMTIVHHKTYYDYHGEYEPYVVLFRQRKPFELYGISKKPLWIHGRERQSKKRSDMFYVASMNWKDRGRKYHGYLDDIVFLSFGIEDHRSGGIDVLASDLFGGLGLCAE